MTTTHKIVSLNINTYLGEEKDAVTLQLQMASLPDGTNYTQQSVLNATAKQLVVTQRIPITNICNHLFPPDAAHFELQ